MKLNELIDEIISNSTSLRDAQRNLIIWANTKPFLERGKHRERYTLVNSYAVKCYYRKHRTLSRKSNIITLARYQKLRRVK